MTMTTTNGARTRVDGAAMTDQLHDHREDKRPLVDANPSYDPDAMES